ncbi:MAG: type 1 glutamine amidotransferase [Qingshengfaniella sp.]
MHIGVLICGHLPPDVTRVHGTYTDLFGTLFAGRGWRFSTWNAVDMELPSHPQEAEAWLVSGSAHGVYDDLPFIPPLEDFLRAIHAAALPMAGICFGHQIIAQALGGTVRRHPGGWRLGRQTYRIEGLGDLSLNAWHHDQVITPPAGARVVAANPGCPIAGLAYGDRILTVQPHPEFSDPVLSRLAQGREGAPGYPPGLTGLVTTGTDTPLGSPRLADWMADFLERAAAKAPSDD